MSPLACVEVGGSSVETTLFADDGTFERLQGVVLPVGHAALVAVPGIVSGNRVLGASNLGWFDVEPLRALGVERSADLVLNDAEAAALGEAALRDVADVVFVGLGTGVGGAVVRDHAVIGENLFGHFGGFSDRPCPCGQTGCLETVAAGWALPDRLDEARCREVGAAVATAIAAEPLATDVDRVVVAGGLAAAYPTIVATIAGLLPDRTVEPSAAPADAKSAAAWGLRAAAALRAVVDDAVA